MLPFLIYEGKVAVALAVFYMFYRLLLKKETFHRFNRVVLVGMVVLSFLLPFCIITIHKPMDMAPVGYTAPLDPASPGATELASINEALATASAPWWPTALTLIFFAGVAFVLVRVAVSILSILRIVRRGECVGEEDGCLIIVSDRDIDPFSWMRFIVLSRKDWEGQHEPILTHEKAHIGYGHSWELLMVNVLSAFQWFNPAVWMLRSDLQELHEYEADDAVLRSGANIREYQYLLIRKAVSKSGYSVANSFNHSILKNRITMMSKSKSPLSRGLRVLWLLPLVCLGIGLQAQTVYDPSGKDSEKNNPDETKQAGIIDFYVKADGTIYTQPGVIVTDVAGYIRGLDLPFPGTTVRINAAGDVPMYHIDALKNQLRGINALKVLYAKPASNWERSSSGVIRNLPPARDMNGNLIQDASSFLAEYTQKERENLCVVRINSAGRVLMGNRVVDDDATRLEVGKAFVRAHGKEAIFALRYDRGAGYSAYQRMQELLYRIYQELRDEKAQELYGKPLSALSETERDAVLRLVPLNVIETEK